MMFSKSDVGQKEEGWETWVRTLANSTNPKDVDLLIAKIKVLLSDDRQSLIRRVEKEGYIVGKREGNSFKEESWDYIIRILLDKSNE